MTSLKVLVGCLGKGIYPWFLEENLSALSHCPRRVAFWTVTLCIFLCLGFLCILPRSHTWAGHRNFQLICRAGWEAPRKAGFTEASSRLFPVPVTKRWTTCNCQRQHQSSSLPTTKRTAPRTLGRTCRARLQGAGAVGRGSESQSLRSAAERVPQSGEPPRREAERLASEWWEAGPEGGGATRGSA